MTLLDFNVTLHQTTLSNGVSLTHFERPGMPMSLRVAFYAGSQFDPVGKEGLAHFAEHMLVSGTKKYPKKEDIGAFAQRFGAYKNAFTGPSTLAFVLDYGDPQDTPIMVDFLAECLKFSLFDPATIETERGAIQAERSRGASNPPQFLWDVLRRVFFQGTDRAHGNTGSETSIRSITRDNLLSFANIELAQRPAVIVASGGTPMSDLCRTFGQSTYTHSDAPTDVHPYALNRQHAIDIEVFPQSPQVHLMLAFPTVPLTHPDYLPLLLLSHIMGKNQTSRLFKRLRLQEGLVYAVSAFTQNYGDTGAWVIQTDCAKADLQRVLNCITEECSILLSDGVSETELALFQQFILKIGRLRMQTSADWADYHTESLLFGKKTTIIDDWQATSQITTADIHRVAGQYLCPNTWYLAMCGDITVSDMQVHF